MPMIGMATTSRPSKLATVTCNATLRAVGLKEFEISQSSSSVRTAESAIVEAKVIAAILRARTCVAGSTSCFAAPLEGVEPARRG